MSITAESLGLSFKISSELKATLKSMSTAQSFTSDSKSVHIPVSLVPLTRRGVEKQDTSADSVDIVEDICRNSASSDEKNEQAIVDDGASETSDPLVEVSAPRSLDGTLDDDDDLDELSADELSHSPPPTLPVILVNLEKLCGYVPNTETELEAVIDQVKDALNEDEFDERVAELFEMNIARHGDGNSIVSDTNCTLRVKYPEFLCSPGGSVLATARVWKRFFHKHKIPVVNRILDLLKRCNRPLLWKSDMRDALLDLARREDHAQREAKLEKWRSVDRKLQLDRLYQVRETFHHRVEMAGIALEKLVDDRDRQIALQQGRGLHGLDLTSNVFAAEQWDPDSLPGDEDTGSDATVGDESSCEDAGDEESVENCRGGPLVAQHENTEIFDDPKKTENGIREIPSKNTNRRRTRGNRRYREYLNNAAQQALEKKTIDEALADQERLLEQFTSQDLLKAQAIVQSLQVRMQQVDDLLESLQDEEWADEEDGFKTSIDNDKDSHTGHKFSLLDQILAMILGSLSPECESGTENESNEHHFHYLRSEHEEVLTDWRNYFGRLPVATNEIDSDMWSDSPAVSESRPAQSSTLRNELGITDNDDEWDKSDDEAEQSSAVGLNPRDSNDIAKRHESTTGSCLASIGGGLRPGGSTKR